MVSHIAQSPVVTIIDQQTNSPLSQPVHKTFILPAPGRPEVLTEDKKNNRTQSN